MRLGELLLGEGLITAEGLEEALESQVIHGGRLGTNLVELGLLQEKDLARVLGKQHQCAFAAGEMTPDPKALTQVDANFADDKDLLPMRVDATRITLATLHPADLETLDAIAFKTGKRVVPVVIPEFRMNQLLRRYCKAFRPMRAIDMNTLRPSKTLEKHLQDGRKGAEADLMSEDEFNSLYAQALGGSHSDPQERLEGSEDSQEALPAGALVSEEIGEGEARAEAPVEEAPVEEILIEEAPLEEERGGEERGGEAWIEESLGADARMPEAPSFEPARSAARMPPRASPEVDPYPPTLPDFEPVPVAAAPKPRVASPGVAAPRLSAQAPAPPPTPPPTPLSFVQAQALLSQSLDREDIARTVLRFALGKWKRTLLLSVQGPLVVGWQGLGEGVRMQAVQRIAMPLHPGSTFKLVRDTRSHYVGPIKRDGATAVFYKLLGAGYPTTAVMLPLLVRGKVVHILYVDNGPEELTPPDVGELLILSQSVGRSYEQLFKRRKGA